MMFWVDGERIQFRFCKRYKGKVWNDFCVVRMWNPNKSTCDDWTARILTLVIFDSKVNVLRTIIPYVIVKLSKKEFPVDRIKNNFVESFTITNEMHILPLTAIVLPLAVWRNVGSKNNEFFAVLPCRKWSKYFSKEMKTYNSNHNLDD